MIICQCAVVSDRLVTQAIAAGARTLAQVCRATDAGRDCGACVFNVKRVISQHQRGAADCVGGQRIETGDSWRRSDGLVAKYA